MEELIEKLNKRFGDKYYNLKLFDVVYDSLNSICTVCFLYPQNCDEVSTEDREAILQFVKEFFALKGEVKIKFKKSFLDEQLIKKEVKNYFEQEHKGITPYIHMDDISSKNTDLNVDVEIKLNDDVLSMIDEVSIRQKLVAYLTKRFIASFNIEFKENQTQLPDEINVEDIYVPSTKAVVRYEVNLIKKVFGGDITPKPEYIKNITKPKMSVILAGKVSNFARKTFQIKKGKRKGQEKALYTFTLKDDTPIDCVYFCPKSNEKTMNSISENSQSLMLLFVGDVKMGLTDRLTYYIKKMSICSPVERIEVENKEETLEEILANHKQIIFPESIESSSQDTLFAEKPIYNDLISSNSIVVFDIETTGLDHNTCEITELGAVKIINGQIRERFWSFVKTKEPIPEDVTALTGITNEMISNAPSIKEVIIDFYNYTRGCIISGHNAAGFDMKFIHKAGNQLGLKFDNQIVDTMVLARQSTIKTANYKLGTIVKALGLTLVDAHRAYNDAHATAEVLLELSKLKK